MFCASMRTKGMWKVFLRAPLLVLVLMASFHWSALDTEKERWCMPSLLPPNAEPPVWRDVLLLEWGAPGKQATNARENESRFLVLSKNRLNCQLSVVGNRKKKQQKVCREVIMV